MVTWKKALAGIFLGIVLIVGGWSMFGSNDAQDPQFKQEQDRVVKFINDHIELANGESINRIEFIEFKKNNKTGTWRITTELNMKYKISFAEDFFGGDIETANYSTKEFRESDEITKTHRKNQMEIVYYRE